MVIGATFSNEPFDFRRRTAGHHGDPHAVTQALGEFHTADARHNHIHECQTDSAPVLAADRQGLFAATGLQHMVAGAS